MESCVAWLYAPSESDATFAKSDCLDQNSCVCLCGAQTSWLIPVWLCRAVPRGERDPGIGRTPPCLSTLLAARPPGFYPIRPPHPARLTMPSEQPQAGDAFLSSLERDMRDSSSRSHRDSRDRGAPRDSHRDYDRSDRSSRRSHRRRDEEEDDAKYRSSRRDPEEEDRRHRRSDRDYSPSRSSRRRRDDDGYYASRREDDYSRSSRPRRDAYDDPYDPYGARRDAYDSYSRGGGGGGWRGGEPEPTPARMRSPTPEGTQPISKRVRRDSKWNIRAEGFEDVSASQAKSTGLFGVPGQSRTLGVPGAVIGRDSTGQAVIPEALPDQ